MSRRKEKPNRRAREIAAKPATTEPAKRIADPAGKVLQEVDPSEPTKSSLAYPIDPAGQDAAAFIKQAAATLADPKTVVYVDTSFLMWLTKGGQESRRQFLVWADSLGDRVHVPVWTYHEYYRHHTRSTMRCELSNEATKLVDAANQYARIAKGYADDPLKAGYLPETFDRELDQMVARIKEVTETGALWDYVSATKQISEWMSRRLCRSKVVFELMDRLGDLGEARYTQDVPPGFRDRTKTDEPRLGSNKYGDLIMWEELLAHVGDKVAGSVVVLTRDRKEDWFAPSGDPRLNLQLRGMRGSQKWNPVPAPHPTLLIELRARTTARDLTLLDSLYFGATLHQLKRSELSRLIAYSIDVRSTAYEDFSVRAAAVGEAAPIRPDGNSLSRRRARELRDGMTSPLDGVVLSAAMTTFRDSLRGDAATADATIDALDREALVELATDDAVVLGRIAASEARKPDGQMATVLCNKLLDEVLPTSPAEVACLVYAGMLNTAYFEDSGALKMRPSTPALQKLFAQMRDPAYRSFVEVFAERFPKEGGRPLYIPNASALELKVVVKTNHLQEQIPAVLSRVSYEDKTLTRVSAANMPGNLRALLRGATVVTVGGLLELVSSYYGLPRHLLVSPGVDLNEQRTIPENLCFAASDDLESESEATDTPDDEVLEQIGAAALEDLGEEALEEDSPLEDDLDE